MSDDLQQRLDEALKNPQNMGELADADRIGTVGNAECGDMLRVWVKFKEEDGRKVIDKASFQSFGCETAIAAASLAMELIRGKTPEEALRLRGEEFARDLGPLPPTKVHCTQLVEGAIRSALSPQSDTSAPAASAPAPTPAPAPLAPPPPAGNLNESFNQPRQGGVRVVFLNPASPATPAAPAQQQQQQQQ
jgi:NifU-like protein involved in Fe-S cluster formation